MRSAVVVAATGLLAAIAACNAGDPSTGPATTVTVTSIGSGGGTTTSSSASSVGANSVSSGASAGGGGTNMPVAPPFVCDTTIDILPGTTTFVGATTGALDHSHAQGCALIGEGAPDLVYVVRPTISGQLALTLRGSFPKALYVVDACNEGDEIVCDGDDGDVSFSIAVEAGTSYFVVVDGMQGRSGGFQLDMNLVGCGDGVKNLDEECDDGDSDDEDGCTNACEVMCPSGWLEAPTIRHCYRYESSEQSWMSASLSCPAIDSRAHLVTLTEPAEVDFVTEQIGVNIWIGGSDAVVEGSWTWVTGESWPYINGQSPWRAGEPNNAGNEDCASLEVGGEFDDQACGLEKRFVCELVPPGL